MHRASSQPDVGRVRCRSTKLARDCGFVGAKTGRRRTRRTPSTWLRQVSHCLNDEMVTDTDIDEADTVDELRAAFDVYERALVANDVDTMNQFFWADPRTTRYGLADGQHGHEEVVAWRRQASPVSEDRRHERVDVTTFGRDFGVVNCEFRDGDDAHLGRQSQVWARRKEGWRIVSAHVSSIES